MTREPGIQTRRLGMALLALMVALVPLLPVLQTTWWFGNPHDVYRQYQLWLLLVAGLGVLFTARGGNLALPVPRRALWLLPGLAVWLLVSALLAELPRWALLEWAHLWLLGGLALAVARLRDTLGMAFDRWALRTVLAGVGLYAGLTLLFYLASLSQPDLPFDEMNLLRAFANPRFFGHFQTLVFPFLVLALVQAPKRPARLLLGTLLVWWWLLEFVAGTRGTVLGVGGALVLLALLPGSIGRPWLRLQVLAALTGWLAYLALFRWLPTWLGMLRDVDLLQVRIWGLSGRGPLWAQAWQFVIEHPWFGVGPMHLARYPTGLAAHPHSLPLQWLAEWGIIPALLALALVGWGLWRLYRSIDRSAQAPWRMALFAALAGAAIQSLVDGIHVMPYSQTLIAIAAGWALASFNTSNAVDRPLPGKHICLVLRGLTALALLGVIVGVAPEIYILESWELSYLSEHNGQWLPRFWLQGMLDRQTW